MPKEKKKTPKRGYRYGRIGAVVLEIRNPNGWGMRIQTVSNGGIIYQNLLPEARLMHGFGFSMRYGAWGSSPESAVETLDCDLEDGDWIGG